MKLEFLRPLYDNYGDYVSVYLDASRAAEDAAHAVELRWRSVRERLAADGADEATLDAVAAAVTDPANAAPGIAVVARHGTIALLARLRSAPRREITRFAALPHVMPLLAQRPPRVSHLRVTTSRADGEILAVTATGRVRDEFPDPRRLAAAQVVRRPDQQPARSRGRVGRQCPRDGQPCRGHGRRGARRAHHDRRRPSCPLGAARPPETRTARDGGDRGG